MACKPTVGKVATQSQGVKIAPNLADALKDIRNDKTSTNWILGSYEGGNIQNQIILVGSGDGGVEQMIPLLKPDEISYGLSRVVDVIDGHPTVKFAFIQFIGANVSSELYIL
ncbi:hypothetical protein HK102_010814 [Quaeritorhiza haematococci]|nr:hypothetical protein HK102_010814 [Quaeritorhiza haematococci]